MSKKIILGKSLIKTLTKVNKGNDKISTFLLDVHNKEEVLDLKYSYFDSDTDPSMLSYLPMNKEDGLTEDEKWKVKTRTSVKIGRVVRAILQSKSVEFNDADIETFVSKYRCAVDNGNFVFHSGEEFGKYYNENTYDKNGGGSGCSLYNSCMRFDKCQEWFTIYKNNPQVVGVLALLNDSGKVEGRALVWKDILVDGVVGTYMDRVYSIGTSVEEKFKQYASARKWWHKIKQSNDTPDISNGERVITRPVLKAQLRSDVNYNYNVKSPYIDSMRQLKFLSIAGDGDKYGVFLTNSFEGSGYRQSYGGHQSNAEVNNNYSHVMDKPFSLSQITNIDMNDITKIDSNTYKAGESIYNIYVHDDIDHAVKNAFVKNPFENIVKFGIKVNPYIGGSFYRKNSDIIAKYVKENANKVFIKIKDRSQYVDIFSKLSREEFLGMVNAVLKDTVEFEKLTPYFQEVNGFGTVITSQPFSYDSWDRIAKHTELNEKLGDMAYERNRNALYEAFGLYLDSHGSLEIKSKYFTVNLTDKDDTFILNQILNGAVKIDIVDFINTEYKDESDMDKYSKISPYFDVIEASRKYIKNEYRGKLLSSDSVERLVLRHYIYKVN